MLPFGARTSAWTPVTVGSTPAGAETMPRATNRPRLPVPLRASWSTCRSSGAAPELVFGAPDVDHLFVPFTDLTSGTETYPAGRYLDLDRTPTGIYVIDFNRAYHPYCYYNPTFDCPYPPAENRLRIPIRAGERLKK